MTTFFSAFAYVASDDKERANLPRLSYAAIRAGWALNRQTYFLQDSAVGVDRLRAISGLLMEIVAWVAVAIRAANAE